jgi:hypothetical protein
MHNGAPGQWVRILSARCRPVVEWSSVGLVESDRLATCHYRSLTNGSMVTGGWLCSCMLVKHKRPPLGDRLCPPPGDHRVPSPLGEQDGKR